MDNDDNVYQGQGFHLVGDENSKVSPVLHPYALPKFDFDEGHLRFDSLVENEVFLGIPSQEDNQWIEDFSRGSSGIEFSSSAADSCPIPRHNNVWSEATSSETVEMLLKSVGQEEMIPGDSTFQKSDAGDETPSLPSQMDDEPKKIEDSNLELRPAEVVGKVSELNDNSGVEDACGESTMQVKEIQCLADGSSGAISEKGSTGVTEGNLSIEIESLQENQREICTEVVESSSRKMQGDPLISEVEVHDGECLAKDILVTVEKSSNQSIASDVHLEIAAGLTENRSEGCCVQDNIPVINDEKISKISSETCLTGLHSPPRVASNVEAAVNFAAEETASDLEEPSRLPPVGISDFLTDKECNEEVCSLEPIQANSFSEGMDLRLQFESKSMVVETSVETSQNIDDNVDECPVDVRDKNTNVICSEKEECDVQISHENSNLVNKNDDHMRNTDHMGIGSSNIEMGTSKASEMQFESSKQGEQVTRDADDVVILECDVQISHENSNLVNKNDDHMGSTDHMVIGSSNIEMGTSIVSEMQFESSKEGEQVTSHADDVVILEQTFTTDGEECGVICDSSKQGSDSTGIHKEDSTDATRVMPPKQTDFVATSGEVSSSKLVDGRDHEQVLSVLVKGVEETTSDPGKLENDFVNGKVIGASPLAEAQENVQTSSGKEIEASVTKGMDSKCAVESTDQISSNAVVGVPFHSAVSTDAVDQIMKQKCDQFEGKRGKQMEAPMDAGRSLLGEAVDEAVQQQPDSVVNPVRQEDPAAVASDEAIPSANPSVPETSTATTNVEQMVAERASVKLLVHCQQNAKEGSRPEVVEHQNPDEPEKGKMHIPASSEVQGSPDLSRGETCNQGSVSGETVKDFPPSDCKDKIGGDTSSCAIASLVNVASKEDKSFAFYISPLEGAPEGGTNKDGQSDPHIEERGTKKGWQSDSHIEAHKRPEVVDKLPSTSEGSRVDPIVVQEISHGGQQTPDKGAPSRTAKGTSERKTRRGSAKSGKENARKGNPLKETASLKHAERGDRLSASIASTGSCQLKQLEVATVERSATKQGVILSVSGTSLPDLNTSAQVSLFFQPPFTDLQQLQLRAQIFVYGSLIQGVAPDEACMVSAFGICEGGRSFWEPAWRACLERLHGQKSHQSISETPVQSRSGPKASEQANKQVLSQNKTLSTPAGRVSSKSSTSPVVNPIIPLSSPLWNISTPSCDALSTNNMVRGPVLDYQALTPMRAYQTPPMHNFTGNTTSWLPQSPFPGSWGSSAQNSAVDVGARFPPLSLSETVKLTPIKEASVSVSSSTKLTSPGPLVHDLKKVAAAPHSTDSKSRKRKKTSASDQLGQNAVPATQTGAAAASFNSDASRKLHALEDHGQGVLVARHHMELIPAPAGNNYSTSVTNTTPSYIVSESSLDKPLTAVSPLSTTNDHSKGEEAPSQKRPLKPEDIAKVDEAKLQAEEASAHAAIAVTHCQNVWCQLEKHTDSSLASDVEDKVTSAAAAIAAAASIAKAAAAAAKIASNVALQAKLMADEALISGGSQNATQVNLQSLPGPVNNVGNATPASILKVWDGSNGSSSIISAAREAARKKIEAASAASRHAENLEAIVKAAELAAEAVSQAGKVVAMGEPLPINKLVEAGPENYWKGGKLPSGDGAKSNNLIGNKSSLNNVEEVADVVLDLPVKEGHTKNNGVSPFPKETSKDNQSKEGEGISATEFRDDKEFRGQKNRRASDSRKITDVVHEPVVGSMSTADENMSVTLNDSGLKESSLVEVFKDNGDFTGAWFSANVLSLKDGKALVCYTDLESDEGSAKLKEWIPLEVEGSKQPRIRLAHPMTSITSEGTRKRRRAAARDCTWSLNDRVDAWIENCWHEGVIVEKNKKDETTISVHFPAQGKSSVVRAWHLRPTLVWKDGEWVEWANIKESLQGDTPREKRIRLGTPLAEGKGKSKVSKNMDFAESEKPDESRLLPLSSSDKVFNIGSTRNENKPEALRTVRSGLQKEGSKVIFGIPKPGKKRKFMDVSKHYVSDRSVKRNSSNDPEKFTKYMMPQVPGPRGWKNSSKIDSKEKQTAEFNKVRGLKSGKPQNLSTRTLPQKDNAMVSLASASKDANSVDNGAKNSTSNDENDSGQQNLVDFVSSSNVEEAAEEPISSTSRAPPPESTRRPATMGTKSERLKKRKPPPAGGKSTKVESKEKPIPEAVEPRRSNRRIQPTSRLLEGLQSSLIVSKIPSVSHDKSQRSHNRVVSKRE